MDDQVFAGDVQGFTSYLVKLIGKSKTLELLQEATVYLKDSYKEDDTNNNNNNSEDDDNKEEDNKEVIISKASSSTLLSLSLMMGGVDNGPGSPLRSPKNHLQFPAGLATLSHAVVDQVLCYVSLPTLCCVSLVCRAWRDAALLPDFWSSISPSSFSCFVVPPLVSLPSPPSPPSSSLPSSPRSHSSSPRISHSSPSSSWDLGSIIHLPRFNQVHTVDLSLWKDSVDDQWLVDNLGHLKHLRHLSLMDCSEVKFTHPDLAKFTSLTSINLSTSQMGQQISNASIEILKNFTNLRSINLHYCEKINDYGMLHVTNPPLPKLQYLDLGNCFRLGATALATISSLSRTLTWLSLKSPIRSNTFIKDDALSHLAKCSRLTHLDIGITDKGMEYIAQIRSLLYLGLASTAITDIGLEHLCSLRKLQVIDITNCYQLTTEAAAIVTTNYPLLKRVSFKGIPLGQHSVWNLSRLGICKYLEDIDFTNTYISDAIMAPEHCRVAEVVHTMNVSYCPNLTDLTVYNICTYVPLIRHLSISHCHRMTDKALEYCTIAKNLTSLDVSGIYSLTKEGFRKLLQARPNLTIIYD